LFYVIAHFGEGPSGNFSPKVTLLFEPRRQRLLKVLALDFEPLSNSLVDILPRRHRSIETTLFRLALTWRRSSVISLRSSQLVQWIGVTQFAALLDHDNLHRSSESLHPRARNFTGVHAFKLNRRRAFA
jgi:hypothetical protein